VLTASSSVATADVSPSCSYGPPVPLWKDGGSEIFACCYGDRPASVGNDRWRASGIAFYRIIGPRLSLILDSSEAHLPIEYEIRNGNLVIFTYTYDPRAEAPTVLFKRALPLAGSAVQPSLELILRSPKANPARVDEIFAVLAAPRPEDTREFLDQIYDLLFELRNYGLINPRSMVERLRSLGSPWWRDGHASETLAEVVEELELVQRSRNREP